MRTLEEIYKQYVQLNDEIKYLKNKIKALQEEEYIIEKELYNARLRKDIFKKEDIDAIFNIARSHPYYNECLHDGNFIRVVQGGSYIYLRLDKNNKIIEIENLNNDKLSKTLIGKTVDITSYEGDVVRGNWEYDVGKIKNGEFVIKPKFRKKNTQPN